MSKPNQKPKNINFGSGPSAKRPGWTPSVLNNALVARSHRSADSMARIRDLLDRTRRILKIPADYKIALTPGSDTGAMEMAMWSLCGSRPVDAVVFDHFGDLWRHDVMTELKIKNSRVLTAPVGQLPNLHEIDFAHDVIFCWNGTTTGVCVPNSDWISPDRGGLTICDATSAAFAYDLPWDLLDVTTYSFQKVLGGEGAHGVIICSPRAMERLAQSNPPWPMPRLFRLLKNGKVNEDVWNGSTINTPSMLCIEDCLDALKWIETNGGLDAMTRRSQNNFAAIDQWVEKTPWADFLAEEPSARSRTSVCLKIIEPGYRELPDEQARAICRSIADTLMAEKVATDIMGHKEAPPNIRLWAGGMVETGDIQKLLPWLDWAYSLYKSKAN
ncbi:MAG: phosphoserine transaminase [Alphaproteobacteria bacterium]|nr:MAG: phosphoserine transaminase [Alphaproteobacteria bacterium]